ncbi:MAG: PIG-L deacetylase family protein [Ilumatobacteraceae bacterium]
MPTAVFVSPHLDDVAFSCGGTVSALGEAGWRTVVVTAFTASAANPTGFALACQLDKGLPPDVDYLAVRRAEDEEFARRAAVDQLHWLDLPEAPHRGYGSADALFGDLSATDDVAIVLDQRLARCLDAESPDLVLAPQALGAHVDHLRVVDAVLAVVPPSLPVWWYRDVPYAIRFPHTSCLQPAIADLPEVAVDVTAHVEGKGHAAVAYGSQLEFQFGGPARCVEALGRFARSEADRLHREGGVEAFRVRHGPHPGAIRLATASGGE